MKIRIGKEKLSSHQTFKVSNNTTTNVGFVQPTLMLETVPNGKYTINEMSRIRLTPMVAPTFAQLYAKHYTRVVNMCDIFPPFASLYAGKPYKYQENTTIPDQVPQFDMVSMFFNLVGAYDNCSLSMVDNLTLYPDMTVGVKSGILGGDPTTLIEPLIGEMASADSPNSIINAFLNGRVARDLDPKFLEFNNYLPEFGRGKVLQPEGADFILPVDVELTNIVEDPQEITSVVALTRCLCIRLGEFGKKLRTIFRGLGIPIDEWLNPFSIALRSSDYKVCEKYVSILPFVAYSKAVYDTFGIRKFVDYNQSAIYDVIYSLTNLYYGDLPVCREPATFATNLKRCYTYDGYTKNFQGTVHPMMFKIGKMLIEMMRNSFYTLDVDYYSSINKTVGLQNMSKNIAISTVTEDEQYITAPFADYDNVYANDSNYPIVVNIANKLLHWVNTDNVIGASIAKWFSEKYGITLDSQQTLYSKLIGHDSTAINIGPIFSQADTESASLGDYSGTGYGEDKKPNTSKYISKDFGFIFSFFCVVPRTSYYQRIEPIFNRKKRFDFFTPEWDSMGFMPVSHREVNFGFDDIVAGVLPRYFDYKFKFDTINGDMNIRSLSDVMSPYWFNRTISPYYANKPQLVMSDDFRRIGKAENLGYYNKIFVDQESFIDHYLVDFGFEIHCDVPMKPIMDSFDTVDDADNQGSTVTSKS